MIYLDLEQNFKFDLNSNNYFQLFSIGYKCSKNLQKLNDFINQQLSIVDEELNTHILNTTPIPNPKYMIEPNQRETKWSDIDNEVYQILDELYTKLNTLLEKSNNIK
jgi:flagellin-specific chaperone FliS